MGGAVGSVVEMWATVQMKREMCLVSEGSLKNPQSFERRTPWWTNHWIDRNGAILWEVPRQN